MMNQILTDIAHSSSPTGIQGVTMLMVFAVVIIFLVSWIINRISILHIRKDSEKIRDLSITLQHTLASCSASTCRTRWATTCTATSCPPKA